LTPTSGPAIAATYIAYAAGTFPTTGTVATFNNDATTIIGATPVVTASAITGGNTAAWNPTLSITIGGTFIAGFYKAPARILFSKNRRQLRRGLSASLVFAVVGSASTAIASSLLFAREHHGVIDRSCGWSLATQRSPQLVGY
jgi:hypothetical protein